MASKYKRKRPILRHIPPPLVKRENLVGIGVHPLTQTDPQNETLITPHYPEAVKTTAKEAKAELAKRELARRHLLPFIKFRFPSYRENWHHRILANALERVENGSLKRLMVFMPPRHGKSEEISINFPAWCMGKNKDRNIMAASYAASLATDFGRKVRNIMDTKEYQLLFDTRLAEDAQAKGNWSTNGRGEYNALGVGGAATGKGADILIIDDPVKNREEADSEVVSESTWDWYKSTARTRLSPDGAIIVVMTRWKDDDLAGRILAEGFDQWEIINFPAIAEHDEQFRKEGEALWGDHFTLEKLEETKRDIGSYEFNAQYQQNPVNRETQIFKEEMFKYISFKEVQDMITNCFITIDTQGKQKATKKSDWTGITINWVDEENIWYFKSYHVKIGETELFELLFDLHKAYRPVAIGIEKTMFTEAIQPFLTIEMARRNIFPNVVELTHGGQAKEIRIKSLVPRYERGYIYHIEGMCKDLEAELVRFPASSHDDVMDSAAYQVQIAEAVDNSFDWDEFATLELAPTKKINNDINI